VKLSQFLNVGQKEYKKIYCGIIPVFLCRSKLADVLQNDLQWKYISFSKPYKMADIWQDKLLRKYCSFFSMSKKKCRTHYAKNITRLCWHYKR